MGIRKWITKREIADILKAYSVRANEFEPFGNEGCSFKNKYLRGYILSIDQEFLHGNEKTGRIIVSHSRSNGKRTFRDVWQRDSEGKLQFVFRNPWDKPFTDHEYIKDLEDQISELKEYGLKLQERSEKCPGSSPLEATGSLKQELTIVRSENEALRSQIATLTEKYDKLIKETKHNARGAGRKPDPAHLESQAKKIQDLLDAGKTPVEIQKIMGISRSSFFKYKKFLKTKAAE